MRGGGGSFRFLVQLRQTILVEKSELR